MGNLIDADKLRESLKKAEDAGFVGVDEYIAVDIVLDHQPIVDPQKHGYWAADGHTIICSECRYKPMVVTNYCPNCGARMDAERPKKARWRLRNGKWTCSECSNQTDWPLKICNVCASEMEIEL